MAIIGINYHPLKLAAGHDGDAGVALAPHRWNQNTPIALSNLDTGCLECSLKSINCLLL
jgi:hypothetical protein